MGKVAFNPRVVYGNKIPLDAGRYKIKVPAGLPVRAVRVPIFKSADILYKMDKKQTSMVTGGVTTAKFKVYFSNIQQQWRQVVSAAGVRQWQFQGGDIIFEVAIGVYILDEFKGKHQIMSIVLEHELLHVYDEIKIVTKDMPAAVKGETLIKKYLINGQVCGYGEYANWFTDKGLKTGSGLQNCCEDTWAGLHNAAIDKRDSGPEWERYRKRIASLTGYRKESR